MSEFLLTLCVIISVYASRLDIKSALFDYMCMLTQYFTRSTNTQENGNVLVACIFRDLTKCLRPCACVRLEQVQPKGRTGKAKKSQTIYAPMLHVLNYVSQAGKVENERMSNRKYRVYIVSMSRDLLQTHY